MGRTLDLVNDLRHRVITLEREHDAMEAYWDRKARPKLETGENSLKAALELLNNPNLPPSRKIELARKEIDFVLDEVIQEILYS